ncbi:MAG: hypothetical protein ACK4N5_04625 [Myxococcales bacterium]
MPTRHRPARAASGAGEVRLQVTVLWGLSHIDVRQCRRGEALSVGNDPGCALQVFAPELGECFPLITCDEEGTWLRAPSSASLLLSREGSELAPAPASVLQADDALAGVVRLRLLGDQRVLVALGRVRLLVCWTRAEVAPGGPAALDPVFARALTMTALVSCAAFVVGSTVDREPPDPLTQLRPFAVHPMPRQVRLPPPPTDLVGEDESRGGEDRVGHLGRIRTFPHIEGNYPTFVYIPGT